MNNVFFTPSWVIPGTYAENLRFLENKTEIKGVELLFFICDNEIKSMLDSEWEEIISYGRRFAFTAHLPEHLLPDHEELIARLAPIVRHFIIHPYIQNPECQARLLNEWTMKYEAAFLAENTNPGNLETLLPYLDKYAGTAHPDSGLCMDTGHLLIEGKNPAIYFSANKNRIREIHLHGINREQAAIDGRLADHRSIYGNETWLHELRPFLENFSGVINLEMFSWDEINISINALQ